MSFQGKQRFMGDEASAIARSNYRNTPINMKRLIGRKFAEEEVSISAAVAYMCHLFARLQCAPLLFY